MTILWKDIPGYEGSYQASERGEIRSLARDIVYAASHKSRAYTKQVKGRILRPGPSNFGHMSVVLGRGNTRMVHDLVLRTFVGPRPAKHECCHDNGNPADNRLENLRWGTRSENNIDAVKHGTRGKLTETQVLDIRARLRGCAFGTQTLLAQEYDVSLCTINAIKFNRVYKHV